MVDIGGKPSEPTQSGGISPTIDTTNPPTTPSVGKFASPIGGPTMTAGSGDQPPASPPPPPGPEAEEVEPTMRDVVDALNEIKETLTRIESKCGKVV